VFYYVIQWFGDRRALRLAQAAAPAEEDYLASAASSDGHAAPHAIEHGNDHAGGQVAS